MKSEASGILNWAVEGAKKWQEQGLRPPATVVESSEAYRNESDVLKEFLNEECAIDPNRQAAAADVWKAYVDWAASNNERPLDRKTFSHKMRMQGFNRAHCGTNKTVHPILLLRAFLKSVCLSRIEILSWRN